jgi:serine/threonine protein kinase
MEFADGGDLYQRILDFKKKNSFMSENFLWHILIKLARALKALHELKVMHRDIKSANVFLTKEGKVKLGDMNVSKVAKEGMNHTQTGTPYYASPEVWKDLPYDSKSDLWSLGCVIYEAASLKPPFRAEDMQGLYKKVIKGEYPSIPKSFSHDLTSVIDNLIQLNPNNRIKCAQLMALPAVTRHIKVPDASDTQNSLLKTIEFPEALESLPEQLPKPNFEDSPPHRNKSNALPKLKTINRQIILKDKTGAPAHSPHTSNDKNSDKSLYYLKYYREMILKENYGALKVPRLRYHYSKNTEISKNEREESSVPRVKSEKIARKQGINKSLLLKIEQKLFDNN